MSFLLCIVCFTNNFRNSRLILMKFNALNSEKTLRHFVVLNYQFDIFCVASFMGLRMDSV